MGTDLIADSGYVDILLSVKGAVRDSADALLHVGGNLVHLELAEAGGGAAALPLVPACCMSVKTCSATL